ncbi:nucleotidyltransferase domain-containing protein [Paenibacillus roseipurpureus]|uniref:Aminoglycoside adenylyltransferase n=1 Tax=Paenibacillus roseopurpureus TaxID=2918901 RepID=A0AA96RKZ3_9BACL|nr:hypothetical protein [Paenibacillus sp. MBLB1832]WNR46908.1 hypothetical protein MJB10_12710 [Paenibacillus sp. MBLB1832]
MALQKTPLLEGEPRSGVEIVCIIFNVFLGGVFIHPDLDFIMSEMKNFQKPWFISGGWVIDIALGKVTREHDDLDICIYREDANEALRYFDDWEIKVAVR